MENNASGKWELIARHTKLIYTLSENNRHRVRSQETFENDCFTKIGYIYDNYERKGWRNIDGLIKRNIYRLLIQQIEREKKWRRGYLIEDRGGGGESREDIVDLLEQIPDDGVEVESNVMAKEKIARLATDDRRLVILNEWSEGYTNDSELAARLCSEFGSSHNTQRKHIQRFRNHCKEVIQTEFAS